MKVSQIASGKSYENKGGDEVRHVERVANGEVEYVVLLPAPAQFSRVRRQSAPAKDFAEWAARPQGTSKWNSADQQKFMNYIQGPKG